ncbi:hypothetical protein [Dyadobacter sp. CY347]|uniref:hypothetical protein n=1 Tax=Dyadobacter sp. CY347 TaxID=2909336 RepID=UPI001F27571B|nr:hypothetical protein [Dyadobacter sp. CY347]MCF2489272.1 hypothetical protein [Dyadobacter sp. CY347]
MMLTYGYNQTANTMNDYVGPTGPIVLGIAANVIFITLTIYMLYLSITFLRLGIKSFRKYLKEE